MNLSKWIFLAGLVALALISCDDRAATPLDSGVDQAIGDSRQTPADGPAAEQAPADSSLIDGAADMRPIGDAGTVLCNAEIVTCKSLPGACNIGEAREVVGTCWGDCVPIEQCSDLPAEPDCDLTGMMCEMMPPVCLQGYVNTNNGNGCFGPCVPIFTCSCKPNGSANQCPQDTVCHNYAQRCGELI